MSNSLANWTFNIVMISLLVPAAIMSATSTQLDYETTINKATEVALVISFTSSKFQLQNERVKLLIPAHR